MITKKIKIKYKMKEIYKNSKRINQKIVVTSNKKLSAQ